MTAPRPVRPPSSWRLLGLALALCLAAAGAPGAQTAQPTLGAPATQDVRLVVGANMVSLRVYPDDQSLASILGPYASQIVLAKTARGGVYAPAYGVHDLKDWPWAEAMLIYARVPFTLRVTGREIEPVSPVGLRSGWSWVPYFPSDATSPEEAFASLGSALTKIEDISGRAYPAKKNEQPLESVEPGVGYRVRLSAAATLTYGAPPSAPTPTPAPSPGPTPSPSPDPSTKTVATIDAALALKGLAVGQTVVVTDPVRGGRFVVRDSGAPTDGGTVFVPTEFTEQTTAVGLRDSQTIFDGPNDEGVVFDSFRLFYGPSESDYLGGLALHGHASGRGDLAGDHLLDTRSGRIIIPSALRGYAEGLTGSKTLTATYRYATSKIRLERVVPALLLEGSPTTDYVRPEWWGTVPYPSSWRPDDSAPSAPRATPRGIVAGDPIYDATDGVATAINVAEGRAAQTGREHYVVLKGMYGYTRVIEMQDRVVLKGERDGVRDGQGLRVLKGAPWRYWAVKENNVDPAYRVERTARDYLMVNSDPMVVLRHGRRAQLNRVVDMELDGNLGENMYVISDEYRAASGRAGSAIGAWVDRVEEMLQNTPQWNGFTASHQHADTVPGSNARLENVHAHDYGGNIILGNEPVHFGGSRDLSLGSTIKNHQMYRVFTLEGTSIDRIDVYGYAWGAYFALQQGHYRDVVFRDLVRNPKFGLGDLRPEQIIGHRNDAIPTGDLYNQEVSPAYMFGDTAIIEGVRFELAEGFRPRSALVGYDEGPLQLTNVTIKAEGNDPVKMLSGGGKSGIDRSSFSLVGLDVEKGTVQSFSAASPLHSRVSQVAPRGDGGLGRGGALDLYPYRPGHSFTLYDVGGGPNGSGIRAAEAVKIRVDDPNATADVFVQRGRFNGVDFPVMAYRAEITDDVASRYRVFWKDVTFDRWQDSNNDKGVGRESGKLQYFERVTVGDRTSEASGSLSSKALERGGDGTRYVDVDPKLFYTPQDPSYVSVTGRDAGRFLGWDNVGEEDSPVLRLTFSGTGPVTAKWTAAIRPIPDGVTFPE